MSRFWALTKVALRTSLSQGEQGKTKWWLQLVLFALMGVIFAPLMVAGVRALHSPLAAFGFQTVIPTLAVILVSVLMMGFSFMQIIEVFFYAGDIEYLLPLPLKSWEILLAKFVTVVWIPYSIALMLYVPVMVTYGILEGAGWLYYVFMVVSFLFIPLYPTILMCLVLMVLMRVTNLGKYRDQIRTVMLLGASISGGLFNLVMQRMGGVEFESLDLGAIMELPVLRAMNFTFQPVLLAIQGLLDPIGSWYRLVGSFVLTALALLIFVGLSESLYFKSVAGFNQGTNSKRAVKERDLKLKGSRWELVVRDFKHILRTPAFAISCLISPILVPFILLISFFSADGGIQGLAVLMSELFLAAPSQQAIFLGIAFAALFFFASTNTMAHSSISREGKSFPAFKYLPIELSEFIAAKLTLAFGYNLFIEWVMITGLSVFFGIPWGLALAMYGFSALSVWFHSLLGFYLDFSKPNLDWDIEQRATSGNWVTVVVIFATMVLAGLSGFLAFRFATSIFLVIAVAYGALILGNTVLWRLLQSRKVTLFDRI